MDLENSLEEANFSFQTNQLPINSFRGDACNVRFRPGTSFGSDNNLRNANLLNDNISICKENQNENTAQMPGYNSDSFNHNLEAVNDIFPIDDSSIQSLFNSELYKNRVANTIEVPIVEPEKDSESEFQKDISVNDFDSKTEEETPAHTPQCENSENLLHSSIEQATDEVLPYKKLNNSSSNSNASVNEITLRSYHGSLEFIDAVNHRYRPNRRKSNLDTSSLTLKLEQSESSSGIDDIENQNYFTIDQHNLLHCSSSSDSEVDYKSDRIISSKHSSISTTFNHRNGLKNFHSRQSFSDYAESQCDSDTVTSMDSSSYRSTSHSKHSDISNKSNFHRRSDRYIRDVDLFELRGIPFSYEDVVYSTNEEFRELKSTLGLSEDQISAMLDARRRATNRQAAERCRKLKMAARDELSERLSQLRLQRQILTQRLTKARQKKREIRDTLTLEQNRLLEMLQDSNGYSLNSTDWRIKLTTEDELVVVSVRH